MIYEKVKDNYSI